MSLLCSICCARKSSGQIWYETIFLAFALALATWCTKWKYYVRQDMANFNKIFRSKAEQKISLNNPNSHVYCISTEHWTTLGFVHFTFRLPPTQTHTHWTSTEDKFKYRQVRKHWPSHNDKTMWNTLLHLNSWAENWLLLNV